MNLFPHMLMRRLILALIAIFGIFILWLVPSFFVMAPDSNYASRILREAELVAAAMARGGLTSKSSNLIGGDPKDPRAIAAQKRSPFNRNRAEGILRQMQAITNKRIVLYDHKSRIIMDSYNFTRTQKITAYRLPPVNNPFETDPASKRNSEKDIDSFYIAPPHGQRSFVQTALAGQSSVRTIFQSRDNRPENNPNASDEFRQAHSILQAVAPIRRLKFVQGAVVLIDVSEAERRAWRWRALFDSAPVFAAFIVALILLLLWLKGALIRPLAGLAYGTYRTYGTSGTDTAETAAQDADSDETKRNDEFDMIARRHQAGQVAAENFAEASRALSAFQTGRDGSDIADSKIASQIHLALAGAKIELVDLSLIIQQCIHRHNMRERKFVRDKMRIAQPASQTPPAALPFGDPVMLERVETGQSRNAFNLPAFPQALTLVLDYIIQGSAASTAQGWPGAVRIALMRKKSAIRIIIEDDGADIASHSMKDWAARAYDIDKPPLYALRALLTCLAMHHGRIIVDSLRPARIVMALPLSSQKES